MTADDVDVAVAIDETAALLATSVPVDTIMLELPGIIVEAPSDIVVGVSIAADDDWRDEAETTAATADDDVATGNVAVAADELSINKDEIGAELA